MDYIPIYTSDPRATAEFRRLHYFTFGLDYIKVVLQAAFRGRDVKCFVDKWKEVDGNAVADDTARLVYYRGRLLQAVPVPLDEFNLDQCQHPFRRTIFLHVDPQPAGKRKADGEAEGAPAAKRQRDNHGDARALAATTGGGPGPDTQPTPPDVEPDPADPGMNSRTELRLMLEHNGRALGYVKINQYESGATLIRTTQRLMDLTPDAKIRLFFGIAEIMPDVPLIDQHVFDTAKITVHRMLTKEIFVSANDTNFIALSAPPYETNRKAKLPVKVLYVECESARVPHPSCDVVNVYVHPQAKYDVILERIKMEREHDYFARLSPKQRKQAAEPVYKNLSRWALLNLTKAWLQEKEDDSDDTEKK